MVRVQKTAARVKLAAAQVIKPAAGVKKTATCTAIADKCTETAHQSFYPLKHFTKTRKTRRMHTVLPSVTHVVVLTDDAFSVREKPQAR